MAKKKTAKKLAQVMAKEIVELKRTLRLVNKLMDKDLKWREESQHKLDWEKEHREEAVKELNITRKENRVLKEALRISKDYVRMLLKESITEHRIEIAYDMGGKDETKKT